MRRRGEQEGTRPGITYGMIDARGQAEIVLASDLLVKFVIVEQNTEGVEANNTLHILRGVDSAVEQVNPNRDRCAESQT